MTHALQVSCRDDGVRRKATRKSALFGLDYLELDPSGRALVVHFLGKAPAELDPASVVVEGGRRLRDLRVTGLRFERSGDETVDDRLVITLDRAGDASRYQLRIAALDPRGRPLPTPPSAFDPRYDRVTFTFGVDCAKELDCATQSSCDDSLRAEQPAIDYLAKDYASFRQLMLDRIAVVMPDWTERHVPDLGVTLVELVAYAADRLSYYQDAVATEAYLDTARTRISLRRHLRLIDYRLHEGCNARAWLALSVGQPLTLVRGTFYAVAGDAAGGGTMLTEESFRERGSPEAKIFEPLWTSAAPELSLSPERNAIRLYTWLGSECCLPKGATRASLIDPGSGAANTYRLDFAPGDVLIFEEVKGPKTGAPADADPTHRHVVRLTRADKSVDPVPNPATGTPTLLWEVEWSATDALPFPLCISAQSPAPDCAALDNVSVARGNVLLLDHGSSVEEELPQVPVRETLAQCESACHEPEISYAPARYRPTLQRANMSFAEPLPLARAADGCGGLPLSAADYTQRDPRRALAAIELTSYPAAPNGQRAFGPNDVLDPSQLARALVRRDAADARGPTLWLWERLPPALRSMLTRWGDEAPEAALPELARVRLVAVLEALRARWSVQPDLLQSGPDDRHFVVEIDDQRRAHLRFGDGSSGAAAPAGSYFHASYRHGQGTAGNVGADSILRLVFRSLRPDGADLSVRNPLPASGGTAYESTLEAKQAAPQAFRRELQRAITADDYAAIAMRDFAAQVQRAAAVMRWNGYMPEVLVAIDAYAAESCNDSLLCHIEQHLQLYRRIGHALHVLPASRVPLRVHLHVCVAPGFARGHVRGALLARFSNRTLANGQRGFFHADELTFGQSIYLSALVAAAQAEPGVVSVCVQALERYWQGPDGELDAGLLSLGALEVAQLDNDPTAPERGVLTLDLEGGR